MESVKRAVIVAALFIVCLLLGYLVIGPAIAKPSELLSPCPEAGCVVTPIPTITPETVTTTAPNAPGRPLTGLASYYSLAGCIGCREDRLMANGQRLDDTQLTVAYNHAPLNSLITITNPATGLTISATVTDRGGFESHGKIIDLSVATRDALGCGDTCAVVLKI